MIGSNYQQFYSEGKYKGPGRGTFRFQKIDWKNHIEGQNILDLGCNNGMLAIESKRRGALNVIGVDLETSAIFQARKSAEEASLDIQFWNLNIESPEFKTFCPSVDTIFFCSMLSHMKNGKEMLGWIDNHTQRLYFESNLGENNKAQIESIKKWTSFDAIQFLGRSDGPGEGIRYMWFCSRSGKENSIPSWKGIPITFLPVQEICNINLEGCKKAEREIPEYSSLKENLERNGLKSPIIVSNTGSHIYHVIEGGKRVCIFRQLGIKDIPAKIIPNS